MRIKRVDVSAELIEFNLKQDARLRSCVIRKGLPQDARLRYAEYRFPGIVALYFESAEFEEVSTGLCWGDSPMMSVTVEQWENLSVPPES